MIDVKDRVPAKPGRVKITKEDGSVEYVIIERADEPVEGGTPINKALFDSILNDLNSKVIAPTVAGENGQVLTVDGEGNTKWNTPNTVSTPDNDVLTCSYNSNGSSVSKTITINDGEGYIFNSYGSTNSSNGGTTSFSLSNDGNSVFSLTTSSAGTKYKFNEVVIIRVGDVIQGVKRNYTSTFTEENIYFTATSPTFTLTSKASKANAYNYVFMNKFIKSNS